VAKISALTTTVTIDDSGGSGRDISADVTNLSINTSRAEQDITGLDKSAMERLLLRSDTTISLSGVYDPGSNLAHAVFKTVGTQAGTTTRTAVIGFPTGTATLETLPSNYNLTVGADGSMTWSVDLHTANGTAIAWS
jgi:hypothetical protein